MRRSYIIMTCVLLLLFGIPSLNKNEKNDWQYYEYVREEEIVKRDQSYYIEYREETIIVQEAPRVFVEPETEKEGFSWMAEKIQNGSHGIVVMEYQYIYNSEGKLIAKNPVPDTERYFEAAEMVYEYGAEPKVGVIFAVNRITKYGADCGGCYPDSNGVAGTSSGIKVTTSSIRQSNGEWKTGILYDGYYVIATSKNIPLCAVVEISGHSFSGEGLEPGVPFQAIVADRGVPDGTLDLFVGSEYNLEVVRQTKKENNYLVEIIAQGQWINNDLNQRVCIVESGPH